MARLGKLQVVRSSHISLGPIVEVTAPIECTNLLDIEGVDPTVTLRLTFETAAKLSKLLNKLLADQAKAVEDSYCGAI
jgi:hypothetical protein